MGRAFCGGAFGASLGDDLVNAGDKTRAAIGSDPRASRVTNQLKRKSLPLRSACPDPALRETRRIQFGIAAVGRTDPLARLGDTPQWPTDHPPVAAKK
jgi:hypothetical protein